MEESPITAKSLVIAAVISVCLGVGILLLQSNDKRTKIVFCDVGQGNAAYIRMGNGQDILVDAGPDKSVLLCLGRFMPFYDRRIDLVIVTHGDSDHYGGLKHMVDRFEIGALIVGDFGEKEPEFKKLLQRVIAKNIPTKSCRAGYEITFNDNLISFYWPPVDFINYDRNEASCIFSFQIKDFRLLFTGDSTPKTLNGLKHQDIKDTDILAVPHHGSRNGLTEKFLRLADPQVAVISVGKGNRFGHPHKTILDLLEAKKINIKRTDKDGDIVFTLKE